jgi:hypothetical protein
MGFEPTDLRARWTLPSAGGAQAQTRHREYRDGPLELDARHAAGIDVELLWDPRTQGLSVVAHDAMSDETVTIYVEADQALEVFRHPFAYAGEPAPRAGLRVKA